MTKRTRMVPFWHALLLLGVSSLSFACSAPQIVHQSTTVKLLYVAHISPAPAFGPYSGFISALSPQDGKEVWRSAYNGIIRIPLQVTNQQVIVGTEYNIFSPTPTGVTLRAYAAQTGSTNWEINFADAAFLGIAVSQTTVFLASYDNTSTYLSAFSAADGTQLWRKIFPDNAFAQVLVLDGQTLYALEEITGNSGPGGPIIQAVYSYKLEAFKTGDGSTIWRQSVQNHATRMIIANKLLVVDDKQQPNNQTIGGLAAYNTRDGSLSWSMAAPAGSFMFPVAAQGNNIYAEMNQYDTHNTLIAGQLVALQASNGRQAWSTPLPIIAQGLGSENAATDSRTVYAGISSFDYYDATTLKSAPTGVEAIDSAHGTVHWSKSFPQQDPSPPLLVGNTLYISLSDNVDPNNPMQTPTPTLPQANVIALNSSDGSVRWQTNLFGATSLPLVSSP